MRGGFLCSPVLQGESNHTFTENPRARMLHTKPSSSPGLSFIPASPPSSLSASLRASNSSRNDSLVNNGHHDHESQKSDSPETQKVNHYLLEAAKEITSESGFTVPKSQLEFKYLSKDNCTFPSSQGPLSTKNDDWLTATNRHFPSSSQPANDQQILQCTKTNHSLPAMSLEQYYRVKCWVETGSFGRLSLPGNKYGMPLTQGHPDQVLNRVMEPQDHIMPGFVNLGKFLPSFPDSYVVNVNI